MSICFDQTDAAKNTVFSLLAKEGQLVKYKANRLKGRVKMNQKAQ